MKAIAQVYPDNIIYQKERGEITVEPVSETHSQNLAIVEAIEDLGLVHAMLEVKDEKPLSLQEALAEMERA